MRNTYCRRVIFRPFARMRFTLTLWDNEPCDSAGKQRMRYRLTMSGFDVATRKNFGDGVVLFYGSDFYCSPLHATDSDETVKAIMGFLTLRPGDTDNDYFSGYTDLQKDYCENYAEYLAMEVERRFGE